ncbi:MAG: diguanylate cyclase, partial [Lachnospiraceae bacterium]|nr:diguanylate cyclase [Lachnospiraceae bacterium]
VTQLSPEDIPETPDGLISDSTLVHYFFEGVEKKAVWLPLSNGMRLFVTVSVFEADGDWQRLVSIIVLTSLIVLLSLGTFTLFYTRRITRPLEQLTSAAEKVDRGDYDFVLEYDGDDEVGRLTRTFKELTNHVRDHIDDLSKRVYIDALTSVKNKGAFNVAIERIQSQIDAGEETVEYAVGMFDCDELKQINDMYGHAKGDVYLKTACRIICRVFKHSPVYRLGGDEFAVIMRDDDYNRVSELARQFEDATRESRNTAANRWEQVSVSMGIAVYSADTDRYALETVQRADKTMYAQKREKRNSR